MRPLIAIRIEPKESSVGADISAFVEIQGGGCWRLAEPPIKGECLSDPPLEPRRLPLFRDTLFFETLCGNSNPAYPRPPFLKEPLPSPRGLPKDVSAELSTYESWFRVGYHHSWLLLEELTPLINFEYSDIWSELSRVLQSMNHWGSPNQVRLVFWFDC